MTPRESPTWPAFAQSLRNRFPALADPGLAAVLLMATLAAWPLLTRASMPPFTDAHSHIFRTYEIVAAWREGIFYPRWAPDFYYGYGYPVFDYYSTLSYYLAAAYGWFFGAVAGVKFAFVLTTYLAALGVYVFARDEWGPAPAVVSAAVFAFTPYIVLVEPIQRGGLPEALAVAIAPWVLWSFTRLARGSERGVWFLATLSLAALVLAHNLMSFVVIGLLGGWLAWRWLFIERPASRAAFFRTLGLLAMAAAVAAALSAFMWLPAALERGLVQYQNAFAAVQARRFLSFDMLLAPMTSQDVQTVDIALYQFRLGWPQLWLGGLGALTLLRPSPHRRAWLFWLLVTIPCLLLMDPLTTWLWDNLALLPYLQFSYRLLAITALSLAFLAGAVVEGLANTRLPLSQGSLAVLLSTLTLVIGLPLLNPAPWPDFGAVDPAAMMSVDLFKGRGIGTTFQGEFLPVTVQATPQPAQPVVEAVLAGGREKVDRAAMPAGATVDESGHDSLADSFQINAPAAFTLRLFSFYWPGWTAYLDGERVPIIVTEPEGFISVAVPAGAHAVKLQLEDTPPRQAAGAISVATGLLLLGAGLWGAARGLRLRAGSRLQGAPTIDGGSGVQGDGEVDEGSRLQSAPTIDGRSRVQGAPMGDGGSQVQGDGTVDKGSRLQGAPTIYEGSRVQGAATLAARPGWLLAGVVVVCLGARGALDYADRWQAAHIMPSVPNAQVQRFTRFDDGLALVGYDLPRLAARPGKLVPLTFYLAATRPTTQPVSVFVHLYGPNGQVLTQADQVDPLLFYPTTRWPLGQPQADGLSLALPTDLPPGQYTLALGLWNRATGERSHLLDGSSQPTDQDKLIVTDVFTVAR